MQASSRSQACVYENSVYYQSQACKPERLPYLWLQSGFVEPAASHHSLKTSLETWLIMISMICEKIAGRFSWYSLPAVAERAEPRLCPNKPVPAQFHALASSQRAENAPRAVCGNRKLFAFEHVLLNNGLHGQISKIQSDAVSLHCIQLLVQL
jgi:hypothetical protein